jgi:hypothetical protein
MIRPATEDLRRSSLQKPLPSTLSGKGLTTALTITHDQPFAIAAG